MAVVNSFATFAGATYPDPADVLLGVTYGDPVNILVGTFETTGGIIPSVSDVRAGVQVGSGIGNLVLPATFDVLAGIGYGSNGSEYIGSLIPTGTKVDTGEILEITRGDDYLGDDAIQFQGDFAGVTGVLMFAMVDDRGTTYFTQEATLVDATTVSLELTQDQTNIESDTYRFSILEVRNNGERHTRLRGFAAVAMSYQAKASQ